MTSAPLRGAVIVDKGEGAGELPTVHGCGEKVRGKGC